MLPLAGGPFDKKPTLRRFGLSAICDRITFAPGKLCRVLLLLAASNKHFTTINTSASVTTISINSVR